MKTPLIEHQAISASAGSGKTFALAHRFIRLLALGVPPERIAAVTFSRKAAGEIFESIVQYLSDAAALPDAARRLAERIQRPEFGGEDALRLLRTFLRALPRLRIGTLDSLMVGILRAFPFELGIPPEFRLTDEDSAEAGDIRDRVLQRLLTPSPVRTREQQAFLKAFKQATFGREEKGLFTRLEDVVSSHQQVFREAGRPEQWGDDALIWPRGSPWLKPFPPGPRAVADLRAWLDTQQPQETARSHWERILEAAERFTPAAPPNRTILDFLEKLPDGISDLESGEVELSVGRRRMKVEGEGWRRLMAVVHRILRPTLISALKRTQGLYRLLSQFEAVYRRQLRERGVLTFRDVQYLLAPLHPDGVTLTACPETAGNGRLTVDFRLDGRLDHWLFDEFQDTSDLQWAVLQNLVDEVVQDPSGTRSLFYVGDVKQAIYGWRGGNARLFHAVLDRYRDRIHTETLSISRRCSPAVLDVVNRVFGDLPVQVCEDLNPFPERTVARWRSLWTVHRPTPDWDPSRSGVFLIEPEGTAPDDKPDAEDIHRAVARLLAVLRPLDRGLSTAILVRKNQAGDELADALRGELPGVPIAHEGKAPLISHPAVSLILSLIRFAYHPGDTLAWRHVRMSPLGDRVGPRDDACRRLLAEIQRGGFRELVRHWAMELVQAASLDAGVRARLDDLVEAAAEFDSGGSRRGDAFLRWVERRQIREAPSGSAIRIMTVHQAKGLQFDLVLLPDLNYSLGGEPERLLLRRDEAGRIQWVLKPPPAAVAHKDPALHEALTAHSEEDAFEELCVLYVAMTRAKHALYLVTSYPGKTSRRLSAASFIKARLLGDHRAQGGRDLPLDGGRARCLFEAGPRDWYERFPLRAAEPDVPAPGIPPDFVSRPSRRILLTRLEPSAFGEVPQRADFLFDEESGDVLDFGRAIHELFAGVGWYEEADPNRLVEQWSARAAVSEAVRRDAAAQFRAAVASADARAALSSPGGPADLWREQAFEVVLPDRTWVTGIFDRVTILRGPDGAPRRAVILDYKSDRVASREEIAAATARHAPQLALYRRALALILGLDPDCIETGLFFTRPARWIRLEGEVEAG